jgi:hypothetical protein
VKFAATSINPGIVINEIMPSNSKTAVDLQGDHDDWIELYNYSDQDISLNGYFLANNDENLSKWKFPDGAVIEANEYLIIWADKDTNDLGLHANFKLSAKGEELYLVAPDTSIIDQVVFNGQSAELSYSRIPNAEGPFSWQYPSYKNKNEVKSMITVVNTENNEISLTAYPNPVSSFLNIKTDDTSDNQTITIYNLAGIQKYKSQMQNYQSIDVSNWPEGVYLINIGQKYKTRVIVVH